MVDRFPDRSDGSAALSTPAWTMVIADRHLVFAEALGAVLERQGMAVQAVVGDLNEALEEARQDPPDVLLLDVDSFAPAAEEVVGSIHGELPDTRVIALGPAEGARARPGPLEVGFDAYLGRDVGLERAVETIHDVLSDSAPHEAPSSAPPEDHDGPTVRRWRSASLLADQLTPREKEVLALLADASSSADIASRLHITRHTVRTHVQAIRQKLQVRSRVEAVSFALRHGVLDVS
jgi:two-component system, NarL family, nitrate/nitrite response regulator NarL